MCRTLLVAVLFAACSEQAVEATVVGLPEPSIVDPGATPLVRVEAGAFEPQFPGRDAPRVVPVAAFELEALPVTNAQFLAFVNAEPRWRRSRVAALFADQGYLAHWRGDLDPGEGLTDRPVTAVSWFAARAYARWRGRRLPTLAEWECAAAQPLADGSEINAAVLAWYGRPSRSDPGPVGSGTLTVTGLHDLHGLIWEWVDDFASAIGTGDARSATDLQRDLFCGAGAVGAARPEDYAAFMRYAMRTSLTGARTTKNLGFRCARTLPGRKE